MGTLENSPYYIFVTFELEVNVLKGDSGWNNRCLSRDKRWKDSRILYKMLEKRLEVEKDPLSPVKQNLEFRSL